MTNLVTVDIIKEVIEHYFTTRLQNQPFKIKLLNGPTVFFIYLILKLFFSEQLARNKSTFSGSIRSCGSMTYVRIKEVRSQENL